MAPQHSTLSPERWAGFPLAQQILMIGNEMNRAGKLFGPGNEERLRNAYERVLNLTDLTVRVNTRRALRRELSVGVTWSRSSTSEPNRRRIARPFAPCSS